MKQYRWVSFLLAAVLFLPACGQPAGERSADELVLWFRTSSEEPHGPALSAQPYGGEARPAALLAALLAGPGQEGRFSPFPRGAPLVRCRGVEARPGVLLLGLSGQYGALADISLTLADYCVVLTLSQLAEVEQVEITAQGHWAVYRSHQELSAEEAVLWDELAEANP